MLFGLKLPPGLAKNGTTLQAAGRWFHATLIRFVEGAIRPLGGWQAMTANQTPDGIQLSDSMADSDGTALDAHTPDGEGTYSWVTSSETGAVDLEINDNAAGVPVGYDPAVNPIAANVVSVISSGADGYVGGTVVFPGTTDRAWTHGVFYRALVTGLGGYRLALHRAVGGVLTATLQWIAEVAESDTLTFTGSDGTLLTALTLDGYGFQTVFSSGSGTAQIHSNKLSLSTTGQKDTAWLKPLPWGDDVTAEMDLVFGTAGGAFSQHAGFVFRANTSNVERYWVVYESTTLTSGTLRVAYRSAGGFTPWSTSTPITYVQDSTQHFKVVLTGYTFQLYVDGVLKLTATDPGDSIASGLTGISISQGGASPAWYTTIDNVTFSLPSSVDLESQTIDCGVGETHTLKLKAVGNILSATADCVTFTYDTTDDPWGNHTAAGYAGAFGTKSASGGTSSPIDQAGLSDFATGTNANPSFTLDGVPRSVLGWRGNDGSSSIGVGTNTKWYAHWLGVVYDITPSGFTVGTVDAEVGSGGDAWGDGLWGDGVWGGGDASQTELNPPAVWHQDNWGDWLVGCCSPNDGELYYWDRDPSTIGIAMTGAPSGCQGLVVTPERFLVALAPGGEVRKVQWPSQETLDDWTPSSTNTAGDYVLEGRGSLVAGRRGKDETLLWTTNELYSMRYIGGTLIYAFSRLGNDCGLIAPGAVAQPDTKSVWMSQRGFFVYDGYCQPMQCEVADYVFGDFNATQSGKVTAYLRAQFGEVTWHYPSSASDENDRYVTFNYRENHWTVGELERTAGCDAGAIPYPVCGASNGKLYEHERTFSHLDPDGNALVPMLEAGPVQLGDGEQVLAVSQLIPDERNPVGVPSPNLGNVDLSLYTSFYPGENEVLHGPFTVNKLTDCRFTGRWVRPVLTQVVEGDWRFGELRVDGKPAGKR